MDKKIIPMYKPKKALSILQKRLMKEHKKHHTKKHLEDRNEKINVKRILLPTST